MKQVFSHSLTLIKMGRQTLSQHGLYLKYNYLSGRSKNPSKTNLMRGLMANKMVDSGTQIAGHWKQLSWLDHTLLHSCLYCILLASLIKEVTFETEPQVAAELRLSYLILHFHPSPCSNCYHQCISITGLHSSPGCLCRGPMVNVRWSGNELLLCQSMYTRLTNDLGSLRG